MKQWIVRLWEPHPERRCNSHGDRPALAVLQKRKGDDGPIYNMRYFCLPCLRKKLARSPGLPVRRPLDPYQE